MFLQWYGGHWERHFKEKKFSKLKPGPVSQEYLFEIGSSPIIETIVRILMNTTKFI